MTPPPFSRITGMTSRVTLNIPKKLSSNILRTSAVSVSSAAPEMPIPALLTSTSILPYLFLISEIAAFTASASVTSARTESNSSDKRRAIHTTVAPRFLKSSAAALPMPAVAPVTTTILPLSFSDIKRCLSLFFYKIIQLLRSECNKEGAYLPFCRKSLRFASNAVFCLNEYENPCTTVDFVRI